MKKPIKHFPIWLILGLALAGCGGETGTTVNPQSSYTTAPYTESVYNTPPANNTGTTGYAANSGDVGTYLPVSTPEASFSAPVKSGVEIQLVSKKLPGIFLWERCDGLFYVHNREATPQQGFLLAIFTLKGREVELQYRALSLGVNVSTSFQMKSTVRADDVTLVYRTKLL